MASRQPADALAGFHPAVRDWFTSVFDAPTAPQQRGWPVIARGESMLLLSPTGSGKTLAAFLWCINRLMFDPTPAPRERCRVLYVSPLKALAVDVERNLRAPLAGIANVAASRDEPHTMPAVAVRTGDTPASERTKFKREPADILITTPESLYLLLTSTSRESLRFIDTVIVDEIHALVPTKRGAHLALSLERLEHLCGHPLQRLGLSATQRPLDEVARFLGGAQSGAPDVRAQLASIGPTGLGITAADAVADEQSERTTAFRPVTIVDAGAKKTVEVRIEVPVEDMARIGEPMAIPSGPTSQGTVRTTSGAPFTRACSISCAPTARRCSSSTAGGSPNDSRRRSTNWRASPSCARITAPSRVSNASTSKTRSRWDGCEAWSPPRHSSSASTWAPSISWCRSSRRHRSRADCSASAVRDTRSAPSAGASSSPSTAATSWPAPRPRARCAKVRSRPRAIRGTPSTCSPSRSSP